MNCLHNPLSGCYGNIASAARRDPHDLELCEVTLALCSINTLREHSYVPSVAWCSSHAASYPEAAIARIAATISEDRAAHKRGSPRTDQQPRLASTTTAGTRRASRRPRPPARRRRRLPGRTPPGAAAATRRPKSGTTLRGVTIATGRPTGTRRARARPAPRRAGRRRAGRHQRTAPHREGRRWRSAARREGHHQQNTRRPAPTSRTGDPRRPGRRLLCM